MKKLTEEKVQELKEQYGEIYKTEIGGDEYVYRPLKRQEYIEMQNEALSSMNPNGMVDPRDSAEAEEKMIKKCVVFPEGDIDFSDSKAGVVPTLSAYISDISGFNVQSEPTKL